MALLQQSEDLDEEILIKLLTNEKSFIDLHRKFYETIY